MKFPRGRLAALRALLVAACQLAAASAACTPESPQLAWTIGFDDAVQNSGEAAAITAWIMRGGCGSHEHLHDFELSAGASMPSPKSLPPGTYGFAAEARDLTCRPFAVGCVERVLPAEASSSIGIVLRASEEAPRCPPHACTAGYCGGDAGVDGPDASALPDALAAVDAGAKLDAEAGALDTGNDAAADAQAEDSGAEASIDGTVESCADGLRRPGGACYYHFDELSLDFANARDLCKVRGAHLVIFDDADEENWVTTSFALPNDFWLGITDTAAEGFWVTELGAFVTYSNWEPPNPNEGRNGNCARVYPPSGGWRDGVCTDEQRVVCELP